MSPKVLCPVHTRRDNRGRLDEILNQGSWEGILLGDMKTGAVIGNHYHKRTECFFYLITGDASIDTINVKNLERSRGHLAAGQGVRLPTYTSHAIKFEEQSRFLLLKSRAYRESDPDTYEFPVDSEA